MFKKLFRKIRRKAMTLYTSLKLKRNPVNGLYIHLIQNSKDALFIPTLMESIKNTPPHLASNTNDIIAWLDVQQYDYIDSDFHIIALVRRTPKGNDIVVGYAQLTYYYGIDTVFLEYIATDPNNRIHNAAKIFLTLVIDWLMAIYPNLKCIIAEVDSKDSKLAKLLLTNKFITVPGVVMQPPVFASQKPIEVRLLALKLRFKSFIKMGEVVHTLHHKHYHRWIDAFSTTKDRRELFWRLDKCVVPDATKKYLL